MNPMQSGSAAVTGAMLAGVICYLAQAIGVPVPPADVAGTMGALVLAGTHALIVYITNRKAAPNVQVTPPVAA